MNCQFHVGAELDLIEAMDFYGAKDPDLESRFKEETRRTVQRISDHPLSWHPITKRTRGCRIHGFPFTIVYQIVRLEIKIVAIAHSSRKPTYWRRRLT